MEEQEGKKGKEALCKLLSGFINQNSPTHFGENDDCCIIQRKFLSTFLHYRMSVFHVVYRSRKSFTS